MLGVVSIHYNRGLLRPCPSAQAPKWPSGRHGGPKIGGQIADWPFGSCFLTLKTHQKDVPQKQNIEVHLYEELTMNFPYFITSG